MIFDNVFFNKHQHAILRLLNSPILGRDIRAALWIAEDAPIVKITPSVVHEWLGGDKYRATLYSNPQYAEALHRSFGWIWKTAHAWDMLMANRLRPAWNLGFDTYSSQPDGTAGIDNFIQQDAATTNNGGNATLTIGEPNTLSNAAQRTLIKFDFTSIPTGSSVVSATFSLWQYLDDSSNARTFRGYRQKRDWVEAQATWNIYKTSNNWQAAGGFGADDCEQTEITSRAMTATEANGEKQWTTWDTTMLSAMFGASPTWTNNGFLFRADTELDDRYAYRSSDYATAGERPKKIN